MVSDSGLWTVPLPNSPRTAAATIMMTTTRKKKAKTKDGMKSICRADDARRAASGVTAQHSVLAYAFPDLKVSPSELRCRPVFLVLKETSMPLEDPGI